MVCNYLANTYTKAEKYRYNFNGRMNELPLALRELKDNNVHHSARDRDTKARAGY